MKRYIGQIRKPLHWRGGRHFLRNVVLPSVTAVLLLLAVRTLLLTHFSLADNLPAAGLLAGDRVLVNRTAYGMRNPFASFGGPERWGHGTPRHGETAVWTTDGHGGGMKLGRITALPGDTITHDERQYVLPDKTYAAEAEIIGHDQLVGRVICVTYSIDPQAPFYKSFRGHRTFTIPPAIDRP